MKRVFLLVAVLSLAGCSSLPNSDKSSIIQEILDTVLPSSFKGDLDIKERIPTYVDFTLKAGNLRRGEKGWEYDWLQYERNGPFFSSAHINLGKRP